MKNRLSVKYLFIIILLTGCDPVKSILLQSSGKSNSSVAVYLKQAVLTGFNEEGKEIRTKLLTVNGQIKYENKISMSVGVWDDNGRSRFADNIDSIVMTTAGNKMILESKADIQQYLSSHIYKDCLIISAD